MGSMRTIESDSALEFLVSVSLSVSVADVGIALPLVLKPQMIDAGMKQCHSVKPSMTNCPAGRHGIG